MNLKLLLGVTVPLILLIVVSVIANIKPAFEVEKVYENQIKQSSANGKIKIAEINIQNYFFATQRFTTAYIACFVDNNLSYKSAVSVDYDFVYLNKNALKQIQQYNDPYSYHPIFNTNKNIYTDVAPKSRQTIIVSVKAYQNDFKYTDKLALFLSKSLDNSYSFCQKITSLDDAERVIELDKITAEQEAAIIKNQADKIKECSSNSTCIKKNISVDEGCEFVGNVYLEKNTQPISFRWTDCKGNSESCAYTGSNWNSLRFCCKDCEINKDNCFEYFRLSSYGHFETTETLSIINELPKSGEYSIYFCENSCLPSSYDGPCCNTVDGKCGDCFIGMQNSMQTSCDKYTPDSRYWAHLYSVEIMQQ